MWISEQGLGQADIGAHRCSPPPRAGLRSPLRCFGQAPDKSAAKWTFWGLRSLPGGRVKTEDSHTRVRCARLVCSEKGLETWFHPPDLP